MRDQGSILILTLIMMAGILLLGLFLQDHVLIQRQIVHNLYLEIKTYYLAQAGIEYAQYRLGEDCTWQTDEFVLQPSSSEQIVLRVFIAGNAIVVESSGMIGQFKSSATAYFTTLLPITRIR